MGVEVASTDGSDSPQTPETLSPILFRAWMLILASVGLSTIMHLYWRLVKHAKGYYATPISTSIERFGDFTIFKVKYAHWHQSDFFSTGFPINYPAPVTDLFEVFFHYFRFPTVAFVVFTTLCCVIPSILFARALRARGLSLVIAASFAISLCIFSWPGILCVDRANMEIVVWVATAFGFWGLATGRDNVAAVGFGLAGSFKLFPFILLAVFFSQRKYSKLLLGIATMASVTLISLWILGPTIPEAWSGITFGIASFKVNYMAQWRAGENGIDHSLFALIKFVMILTHLHGKTDFFIPLQVYLWVTALGGVALYLFRIRSMPVLNQALLLTVASIYLTAFSGDGTLIHLYGPLAMMIFLAIDAWRRRVEIPGLEAMVMILTLLVTPLTFLVYKDHRFEGQVKCVALGVLFYLGLRYPLSPPLSLGKRSARLSHPNALQIEGIASSHIDAPQHRS